MNHMKTQCGHSAGMVNPSRSTKPKGSQPIAFRHCIQISDQTNRPRHAAQTSRRNPQLSEIVDFSKTSLPCLGNFDEIGEEVRDFRAHSLFTSGRTTCPEARRLP